MNKHILLVIDHLANPDKYTKEQLEANAVSAATVSAAAVSAAAVASSAYYAAAYYAAAYYAAAADDADDASYWVDEYFDITREDKQTYIDKLGE
jgi:hypothetical protein